MTIDRLAPWTLLGIAIISLLVGLGAELLGERGLGDRLWIFATLPVIVGLAVSMVRDLLAGRLGVDAIALLSMSAALVLGQPLAGVVVALMYSGGNEPQGARDADAGIWLRAAGR